jgi:hypothetical protein
MKWRRSSALDDADLQEVYDTERHCSMSLVPALAIFC